jgi:hypothetical protein
LRSCAPQVYRRQPTFEKPFGNPRTTVRLEGCCGGRD